MRWTLRESHTSTKLQINTSHTPSKPGKTWKRSLYGQSPYQGQFSKAQWMSSDATSALNTGRPAVITTPLIPLEYSALALSRENFLAAFNNTQRFGIALHSVFPSRRRGRARVGVYTARGWELSARHGMGNTCGLLLRQCATFRRSYSRNRRGTNNADFPARRGALGGPSFSDDMAGRSLFCFARIEHFWELRLFLISARYNFLLVFIW